MNLDCTYPASYSLVNEIMVLKKEILLLQNTLMILVICRVRFMKEIDFVSMNNI